MRNVFVRLERDGLHGFGEASPNAFYGETSEGVSAKLAAAADFVGSFEIQSVTDIEKTWDACWSVVAPSRAAQCALDVAFWDWLARRNGTSVAELAWGAEPKQVPTFCTIGLSTPDELDAKIEDLRDFPMIKVKADASGDLGAVRLLRERSRAAIAVDANCAWSSQNVDSLTSDLARLEVIFLEQPLPPDQDARLMRGAAPLPIIADESCVTGTDVDRVAAQFDGFNIKLVKCGGITPALRMVRRGRELGLKIMVGCMLESSVLIAAGAAIAQATDYADLDGAWLLRDDPFAGWRFKHGVLHPPASSGLGVAPLEPMFAT